MDTITWTCKNFEQLSLNELYQLLYLRQEVFIVEQNCPYFDLDFMDQAAYHLCGYDSEGDLVAYTRLLPKGTSYPGYNSIGRVITSAKIRGKGLGRGLMELSIDYTRKLIGDSPIKIGAQDHLRKYYGSLGFEPVGETYYEDGILHISMILK